MYDEQMFHDGFTGQEREHLELLLKVARRYFLDDAKQAEIAAEIGYSRVTVSRLLAEARQRGMVRIEVSHPYERLLILEEQLRQRYRIPQVRVAATSAANLESATGRLAAELLVSQCNSRSTIAISNGRAVAATVEHIDRHNWVSSCVVPILGMMGEGSSLLDSPDLCRKLARRLGGSHWALPVPLVFESEATANAMRKETAVRRTLELAARADAALVGVGEVGQSGAGPVLSRWMNAKVLREVRLKGAVAHICGHFLDQDGRHVSTSLCSRTVCLDPDLLRRIPFVVAVAHGTSKVPALRAVIAGRYVDGLVVDEQIAVELLKAGKRQE